MKETLENSICDNCKENIYENQIKIEHNQLEDEVKRLTAQAYKLSLFNKDIVHDKMVLLNLALDALNELFRLYENDKPLWRQWVEMFPCVVEKTYTTDVISTGIGGNKSGSLLLIKTELQIISDLVYVREVQFLRFCKKYVEGVWAIIDVSGDTIQEGSQESEIENCWRFLSGCILQDMPNSYCQVTWIEHMEYNENLVHDWYRPLIKTGLGFGAHRWMVTLQRQYQFLKVMKSIVDPIVILQYICMDATRSLLVYATIDSQEINTVMKGGNSSCVTLFSNGIAIVPDCFQDFSTTNNYNVISGKMNNGFDGGSLVTISFQMMGNIFPNTTLSMELVKEANALISHTIHKIKSALKCK
uniref:Homeobox protein n=1 Tax=Solanum tuberosum TaxID=4113 RepID=M1C945_SOLTU